MIARDSRAFSGEDSALTLAAVEAMGTPPAERAAVESRMRSLHLPVFRHLLARLQDGRDDRRWPLLVGVSAPQAAPRHSAWAS